MQRPTRMGLFWILFLFTALNIINQSFSFHAQRRKLFHYNLYDPLDLITAKLLINFIKLLIAGVILIGLQILFSSMPLLDPILFFKGFILAALGIALVFTLISSISTISQNQNTLTAILAIPLLIPVLLISMRVSLISERMIVDTAVDNYFLILGGINIVLLALTLIFFPLTWKS